MRNIEPKTVVIWVALSYVVVTFLNYMFHLIFPNIPILKTGIGLILIFVAILIVMLFSIVADRKIERIELYYIGIVLGIMLLIYFVVQHYIPELFQILPDGLKESFSFLP